MPQAAIYAIADFFITAFGVSAYTYAAVAIYYAATVFVYAATSYLLSRASLALAPKPKGGGGQQQSLEANYFDTGASIRIGYGRVRSGGMETIPPITSGVSNEWLHKVITLVGHEIDSYNYIHFDVNTLSMSQINPMSFSNFDGQVNAGTYSGKAYIRPYLGTATDSADRILTNVDSTAFGNSRARGIAKVATTFVFSKEIYPSVPAVGATYQAKRCYDPRLDVTPGASPTNPSYIRWTQNCELCLIDYLMASYGGDYPTTDIDWTLAVVAANACDALVTTPAGNQARYTTNGLLFATEDFAENVKTLVNAMLGRIVFRDGKWRTYAGGWQSPTFTIQKKDWISGLSIRFEQGKKKRFNAMRTWFIDPLREWQRVESLPRSNATYKAADGNEDISAETDQNLCTDQYEAERKGEFLLRQSRNQIIISGRLPPRMQNIALWDTGTIVFDQFGWASKTFRCVGTELNTDGSIDGTFAEEQSTDWTDLLSAEYGVPSTKPLPAINVMQPTAPPSLLVSNTVGGTLAFDIGLPIVNPANTRYQLIRSANSIYTITSTVIYDGLDRHVEIVVPASNHWYFARAYTSDVNSSVAFYPPLYGVFGRPNGIVTAQINSNAATELAISSVGNIGGPAWFSGANSMTTYSNTLSYVNSTNRVLNLQVDFGLLSANVSWSGSVPAVSQSFYSQYINGALTETIQIVEHYEDLNVVGDISPSLFIHKSVAPGELFECLIGHHLEHSAAAALNFSGARISLTAVKV